MSDKPKKTSKEDDIVITPGGPRPKDRVHPVGPGKALQFDDKGIPFLGSQVDLLSKKEGASSPMPDDLVLTPVGYRPLSLVHRVELGHAVNAEGGRLRIINLSTKAEVEIPRTTIRTEEFPPLSSGWISDALWRNSTPHPITSFVTTWQVPPAPATPSSQLIYLFNSLMPAPQNAILQPVLQWGTSGFPGAGDGPFWTVASW
jgi:hypothetical protein